MGNILRSFSFQKKVFFALLGGFLVLGLLIWLVFLPLVDKIKEASKEYWMNQETLSQLDQKESLFKEIKKAYEREDENFLMIENIFLREEEIIGFISTLERVANQTNNFFEIESAQPSKASEEVISENNAKKESFLSLKIRLWGSFNNLLDFMAHLENSPYPPYRLIEIKDLMIKRLEEKDLTKLPSALEEGDLETSLVIKIYTR